MDSAALSGKVQTVLGPIEPDRLGITLTHEHLLIDLTCYFQMPDEASERELLLLPVLGHRLKPDVLREHHASQRARPLEELTIS